MPYNSQQNGVLEWKNTTIIEVRKAMIHDQNLPMYFWVEAINTTIYIQNRSPHATLENITPKEAFSGINPNLSHLRIFGLHSHSQREKV